MPKVCIEPAVWDGVKPRKWQDAVFPEIRKHFAKRNPVPAIISAVMGSGKSALIREVALQTKLKENEVAVIVTNTIALVDSLYELIAAKLPDKVGRFYSYEKQVKPINVVCYDSLENFIKAAKESDKKIVFLIVDEAHVSETNYFLNCVEDLEVAVLGLTGTAFRTDEDKKLSLFEKLIYKYGVAEAIKDGVIVDWLIKNNERRGKSNNQVCMEMIKKEDGQGIANASNIDDAVKFSKYLNRNGVKATVVHSGLPRSEIIKRTEDFSEGKYKCMVHVNLLRNGVDIPFIKWSMLRRHTTSRVRFIQEVGRALRVHKDKDRAVFLDPQDLFGRFDISPEEALGYYEIERKFIVENLTFSDFKDFTAKNSYETVLAVENLIRNIQVKFSLYGFNINRTTADKLYSSRNKKRLLAKIKSITRVKDAQWKEFLSVVYEKIDEMRPGYYGCLLQILHAIEIIGFYPSFDEEMETIGLTKKQQELLFGFNQRGECILLTWDGRIQNLASWAREKGQAKSTLLRRYREGWTTHEIINGRPKVENLIGKTFGLWTVVEKGLNGKWVCKCACGNPRLSAIQKHHLFTKKSQSCGCKIIEHRQLAIGDKNKGESVYSAKLTKKDVLVIWDRLNSETPSQIADDYFVGASSISNIKLGRTWKQVTKKLPPHLCRYPLKKCKSKAAWRGLCTTHYNMAKRNGILDEVAIPKERRSNTDIDLKLKKRIQIGSCRLIEDGKGCRLIEYTRGLCHRHYDICAKNGLLGKLGAERAAPNYTIENITINPAHKEGACRVSVHGKSCHRLVAGRGLCSAHYTWLRRNGFLERFALRSTRGRKKHLQE